MEREQLKYSIKMDFGGILAINPERYTEYLEGLASQYGLSFDEAKDITHEALSELPCYLD